MGQRSAPTAADRDDPAALSKMRGGGMDGDEYAADVDGRWQGVEDGRLTARRSAERVRRCCERRRDGASVAGCAVALLVAS